MQSSVFSDSLNTSLFIGHLPLSPSIPCFISPLARPMSPYTTAHFAHLSEAGPWAGLAHLDLCVDGDGSRTNHCLVGSAFAHLCCSQVVPQHFTAAYVSRRVCHELHQLANPVWVSLLYVCLFVLNWLSSHYIRSSIQPHWSLTSAERQNRRPLSSAEVQTY